MFENIPQELKKTKQWVFWAGDKLPKNPTRGGEAIILSVINERR